MTPVTDGESTGADARVAGTATDTALGTPLSDSEVLEFLPDWMSQQRWYAGKGSKPELSIIGAFSLVDAHGLALLRFYLVLDQAEPQALYQVPLTERSTPLVGGDLALVATVALDMRPPVYVYDGPRDPALATALLQFILSEGTEISPDYGVELHGHSQLGDPELHITGSRVLGGEQSNTSIIYDLTLADGTPAKPIICKIFRALHHGDNPDVVLLSALGEAGSLVVPRTVGDVSGQWRDSGRPDGLARGHLAFAQEFLPGVEDAWRVTLRAAEEGRDFTVAARALGEATAEVHEMLAGAFETRPCTHIDVAEVIASMRRRLDLAIEAVPELTECRAAIDALYTRAASSQWPPLQRIHGDLHLGQVLAVPDRGWVLLDFEGEPMRPMWERSLPDIALRDVAGMLRSFDYVAGAVALAHPGQSAKDWSLACRRAFVDGYGARAGCDLRANRVLLDAFEIDKAAYEAVYEARNRPEWLSIPTDAIRRLAARAMVN